ncbi:MAG TPA: TAXI family TRAP transporter solute-binding subunit [Methylomirabilota bacterium]|nr:TAXI family TRAP transporter solute-binding subunit [Methylomirabilota bacterium]
MLLVRVFVALLTLVPFATGYAQERPLYKIVTASERGTYIQIGRDLAKYVADQADIDLEVLPSKGSAENVNRLRYEPGVKFALVQSDVFQAFQDEAAAGNFDAGRIIKPLRVIMPLYDEEIYFVTRADSPLKYIHEIKDKKINIGPLGSGTAMSTTTLYRLMFNTPIPEANISTLSNEEALIKLTTEKTLDVVVIVAGQPAKLFVDMKPEANQYIKLLRLDETNPATAKAVKTYFPAMVRASSYSNWLTEDVPSLSVKAFLVTYDYNLKQTKDALVRFARSLCENFPTLQNQGHPKWKQVALELPPLGKGWSYYPPIEREIRNCRVFKQDTSATFKPRPARLCTLQEKVLGLCAPE